MKAGLLLIGLTLAGLACAPPVSDPVPVRPPWVCFANGASGEWTLRSRSGSFPAGACDETISLAFEL